MIPCLLNLYESSRYLIIYFHSNAEDLGLCRWFCRFMHEQFQVHVLAVEYPGYGVCGGRPTPEGVIANAHAALQFVNKTMKLPLDRILAFGRSLGTGPAVDLASRFHLAGLVLVTPFMSVKEILRSRLGSLADLLTDDFFQNIWAVEEVKSPTLIIHGKLDEVIPVEHGEAIYAHCMARKGLVCPPDLSHNSNITLDLSIFVMPMLQFFNLPECCFDELEVPDWIYETNSPLAKSAERENAQKVSDDLPMLFSTKASGNPPLAAKLPTVRHKFEPTKGYNFQGLNLTVSQEAILAHAKPALELREDLDLDLSFHSISLEGSEDHVHISQL